MEGLIKRGHLTLIPGGGGIEEPIEAEVFRPLPGSISRSKLAWLIVAKLILLASVLYVAYGR